MDDSDGELLKASARGDAEAFGRFYRRHERRVLAYAVGRCTNAGDVADLVAETFLAALGSASRFRDDGGDAIPWLYGIARRVSARQRRSYLRRQRLNRRLQNLPDLSPARPTRQHPPTTSSDYSPELVRSRWDNRRTGSERRRAAAHHYSLQPRSVVSC